MQKMGLASHLKVFPENEVRKGQLTMQLKRLRETQESLTWPSNSDDLPVVSFDSCAYIFFPQCPAKMIKIWLQSKRSRRSVHSFSFRASFTMFRRS